MNGRSSGSGKYSYHERSFHNRSVMVAHMPDDSFKVRIAFRHSGETQIPIIKVDMTEAEMLWAALNAMAKDLNWKDYEDSK